MDDERELPDPADVTKIILERIPGAYERAEDGRAGCDRTRTEGGASDSLAPVTHLRHNQNNCE